MTTAWREVGDRVWIRRYAALDQTIGAVGGEAGLLVIDTRAHHRAADELLGDLRQLPGSVAVVVKTHGHWDHAFGNARFVPTPIWGHERCAAMVTQRGPEVLERLRTEYPSEPWDEVVLTAPTELIADSAAGRPRAPHLEPRAQGPGHTPTPRGG